MSSADARMWEELVARVARIEEAVVRLSEKVEGRDLNPELYGAPADHTADRAERARPVPGRPPGPRAA